MNKLIRVALLAALVTLPLSSTAKALTSTTTFPVTATIVKNCSIAAAALAFGNYDPVVVNAAAPLNATSTVTVACTKGVSATVSLDAGLNAGKVAGVTRAMSIAGPSYLGYEIYSDSGRTIVWSTTNTVAYTAASKAPFAITDYGQIPAGQDQPTGGYTDTITATITF
jgi:spore coat protein U domain-containing protein, fimbrial subunit CupE1/2/3/6